MHKKRQRNVYEYMFVFSKGKIKTTNIIKDQLNKNHGNTPRKKMYRRVDGSFDIKIVGGSGGKYLNRHNIWRISPAIAGGSREAKVRKNHPAAFPEILIKDHIISWSNKGDVVLDPMMGSGTVGAVCMELNRNFIGIEKVKKYFNNAKKRIENGS